MDWTAGYASDVEYTAGFYVEQSPTLINFVSVLNGYEPVPLDEGFTYCELGFGRGLTVSILAATHPQGRFYATDFNPAQVAGARALAKEAGLDNLVLLENSFEELAEGRAELPQFDFITLHGIYTWVTRANQQHIMRFIARYLKPGGLVFLSYNAMPGWAPSLPLQRLLVEFGDEHPKRSDLQISEALQLVNGLETHGARYMLANPGVTQRLSELKTANPKYLVHEYMHKHWQPLYHADVARDMQEAKLDFVGQAEFQHVYTKLLFNEQQRALIDTMNTGATQETLKDYLLNTAFRKDVFVRGARRMTPARARQQMGEYGFVLTVPRAQAHATMRLSSGEVTCTAEVFNAVADALTGGPVTIDALMSVPPLQSLPRVNVVQACALMCVSSQAQVFYGPHSQYAAAIVSAQRLNLTLASRFVQADEFQYLAAPVLGNGLASTFVERLMFALMLKLGADASLEQLARAAWEIVRGQGRTMLRQGVALEGDEENVQELINQMHIAQTERMPLWRSLNIV